MKKQGFTLVEILAVIVVLGVVSLVAVPVITNIIKESKEKAVKASAYSYVEAVKGELELNIIEKRELVNNKKLFIGKDSILDSLKVSGEKPTSGIITLDEDNNIKQADLCVNNYYVTYKNNTATIVSKECDFRIESSLTYKIADDINEKIGNDECTNNNGTYSDKCYFTGDRNKITTNKILYTGLIWDIIGIEPNGDLKLISEQPLTSLSWGNSSNLRNSYVGKWLNEEFRNMIRGTDLEANLKSISLLTEDEYFKYNGANSYLDTRTSMWLKDDSGVLRVVTKEGSVGNATNTDLYGVRPVVVISNSFVTGTGTYDDMYKIVMDTNTSNINKLKNGDFVKLNNKYTVRVIDNNNLKVILHGILNRQEGFNNFEYKDSNIEKYLTNTFANEDGIKEYIDKNTHDFYNGIYNMGDNYNNVKLSTYKGYIALPTIGELFSGSDLFIQIQNTNNVVSYLPNLANQTNNQWLLTPNSQGNYEIGYNGLEKITNNNAYGIRPVFYLKKDLVIKSGDGSPINPYTLK